MSGLEVVGVVASTFQLAEIGIKLSVKLCSFYRQIKDADQSAQRLASDVSLTCSILHQLGKVLEQDSQTKLCSQQAFLTAQEVLEECERIFQQIDEAIQKKDPGSGKSKWERRTRRLTIVILGPDLEVLNSHLDKLKSTMLLMLNVIMYAREINRTSDHASLQCQRQLIETLLREKAETEARLKELINVANTRSDCDREGTLSSSTLGAQPGMAVWQQPSTGNEIDKYYDLVKSLLNEIDECRTSLQQDRHLRIRDGVVNVHKVELAIFQQSHGEAAVQAFDSPFFNICNPDMDSSFTSKPNSNMPPQKIEPSTRRSTFSLERCHSLERSSLPVIRRVSTSNLNLETTHKTSRNHYEYREYSNLEHGDPTGEMFINQPSRERGRNSASAADRHETCIPLSASDLHPVISSDGAPSPSPFHSTSNQYLVPHSSHSSHRRHRRMYSTDYASDTSRLDQCNRFHHHSPQQYQPYASSGRRRDPAYEVLKKGDDVDSYNAYSYTTPREQFDRDYPVKPRHSTTRSSLDRPLSMNVMDEHPQAPPSPEFRRNSLSVRPRKSNNSSTEAEKVKMSPEPLKQPKGPWTKDTKRPLNYLPPRVSSNSMLETKHDIQNNQQKQDTRGGLWDEDNHYGDTPGGKFSADGDVEKDDRNEDESMEADTPSPEQKALDFSNSKKEATSSGKEGPKEHVAWDTLEDLVLFWTMLPRDMIQL